MSYVLQQKHHTYINYDVNRLANVCLDNSAWRWLQFSFHLCDHYSKIADWVENVMKTWLVLKAISKIIKSSSIHFPFKIPRRVVVCVRPIQTRLEWYRRHFSAHQLFVHQNAWPFFSNFDNIFESIRIIYCTAAPRKSNNLTNLLNIWHAKLE